MPACWPIHYIRQKRNEPPGEGRLARFCLIVGAACAPLCLPGKENNAVNNNDRYIEGSNERDAAERDIVHSSTRHDHLRHGNTYRVHTKPIDLMIGARYAAVKKNVLRFTIFAPPSAESGPLAGSRLGQSGRQPPDMLSSVVRRKRRQSEYAPVAQGIERLVADQKVGGSNPSGRTSGTTVDGRGFLLRVNHCSCVCTGNRRSDILIGGEVSERLMVPISKIGVV